MADETQKASLVADFSGVTGVDADRAKFFLESSGWQLQVALGSFYDNDGGDDQLFHDASERVNPRQPNVIDLSEDDIDDDDDEDVVALSASAVDQAAPNKKAKASASSRVRTVSDFMREAAEAADSDSGEEGQTFYAGGSDRGSGQQVVGPRRKKENTDNIVNTLFKNAKDHGAQEVGAGTSRMDGQQTNTAFKGAGYRLGDTDSEAVRPVPGTVGTLHGARESKESHVILKLWKNGFSLNDGELRDYKSPQNAEFLNSISQGEIPSELLRQTRGGQVNLDLEDHKTEDFVQPKVKVKPFSGQGNMLGSPVPRVVSTPAIGSYTESSVDQETVSVDSTQPVTSLQLRLADGTRLVSKFNHGHTVADIRRFIQLARPAYIHQPFALLTTFPNKTLTDDSQTLADAQLLNAVIVQRLT